MFQGGTDMKKILAMLLTGVMMLSISSFAFAEEAGFDEYELGVEGEQDVDFMTMSMVYFQPVDMAPSDQATPKEGSDLHIEVDLTANENPYSFPVDGWVPYKKTVRGQRKRMYYVRIRYYCLGGYSCWSRTKKIRLK